MGTIHVAVMALPLSMAMPLSTPCAAAGPPQWPVEEHQLSNGLRVVLAPDPTLPDVTVCVRFDAGSADDPNGLEGLAHVVEHLHFQGSRHVAPGDHNRLLESAGGTNINATTTPDATTYVETVPPEALELALWLEADRMGFADTRIDDALVSHERTIVDQEYRLRVLDSQLAMVGEIVANEVFPPWHPYHVPLEGLASVDRIQLADVNAFIRTWYTPANARVVVAGQFDAQTALDWVTRYFGGLPSVAAPPRPGLPPSWRVGDVRMNIRANVLQKYVVVAWRSPPLRAPDDRPLDLAARLLAGPQGLFVRKLVSRDLAVSVSARQHSMLRGSEFVVNVEVHPGVSVTPVGLAIEEAIAELAAGPDEADLARARKWWADRQLSRLETSLGRAAWLTAAPPQEDRWELGGYDTIDSAAVAGAVRRWLLPEGRSAAVVYPAAGMPLRGAAAVVDDREKALP